jgi:transposase
MLKKAKVDYAKTIQFVCSDMWQAYLTVIARKLPAALHILDRYQHIFPEVRRSLARTILKPSPTPPRVADISTAARVAAGA